MVQRTVKFYSERTSHDLAPVTQRLVNSKIQDLTPSPPALSMRIALDNLKLSELQVVYPGNKRYTLAKGVEVVPLAQLVNAK